VRGWKLAGTLVPLAYIGWSVWLLVLHQVADLLALGPVGPSGQDHERLGGLGVLRPRQADDQHRRLAP